MYTQHVHQPHTAGTPLQEPGPVLSKAIETVADGAGILSSSVYCVMYIGILVMYRLG